MVPADSGVGQNPAVAARLDPESAEWLQALAGTGPKREAALARLHGLLVRIAQGEVRRRGHQQRGWPGGASVGRTAHRRRLHGGCRAGHLGSIAAMVPADSGAGQPPAAAARLDPESAEWLRALAGTGPKREAALAQLHGLLERIAQG